MLPAARLMILLLFVAGAVPLARADGSKKMTAFVPLEGDREAWQYLPKPEKGAGVPLPPWARATAKALPRTTAAMLELDYLHRVESPLPARLRGMMRWAAAHANRCDYTQRQALDDLRRDKVDRADIVLLTTEPVKLPPSERDAVEFAEKMTSAAYTVTDEEVAALTRTHGEKGVVAMVLLLAYANFQDRLILSLGLGAFDPMPPVNVRFPKQKPGEGPTAPARVAVKPPPGPEPPSKITDKEWLALDYDTLQKKLAGQRERKPRVRVPTPEDMAVLNPDAPRTLRIKWSLVCSGYQPKSAAGWSACTNGFRADAKQDRAFEELLFWVVTRSLNCFY